MPHYQRNIRFIVFLILPIIAFLLGWSLNQQFAHKDLETPPELKAEQDQKTEENLGNIIQDTLKIKFHRKSDPKNVDLSAFWETWNTLESNFLKQDKIVPKDQIHGAIKGLVESLGDPYTIYMTPEEAQAFDESISGELEGIGAEISARNENIVIVAPLKGSPAEQSGLQAGDTIYKINDEVATNMTLYQAVMKIRGPKGEKVALEILREGEHKPLKITIVRDRIYVKSLEWKMQDEMALIEISQFGSDLSKLFKGAINDIVLENPQGIVIDLRQNGGGLLDECIELANEFFSSQVIVKTNGRKINNSERFVSTEGGAFLDIPLIVLVDAGSASASEIFAGAVVDNKRGVLLGKKTFGKGSVQNVIPISNGGSLKITIAEWLTPNGGSIHETGIIPDEDLERTREDRDNDQDPVLERAIGLLKNPEELTQLIAEREQKLAEKSAEKTKTFEDEVSVEAEELETFEEISVETEETVETEAVDTVE